MSVVNCQSIVDTQDLGWLKLVREKRVTENLFTEEVPINGGTFLNRGVKIVYPFW